MIQINTKNRISEKVIWHCKILLGAIVITFLFSFILGGQLIHNRLPWLFVLTFIQLELFVWMGSKFFTNIKSDSADFKKQMIIRLLLFYFGVLLIAFLLLMIVYAIQFIIYDADFSNFFVDLFNFEVKKFLMATLVGFTFGAIIFFYAQWSEMLKKVQKLKEESLIFKYETLKNQVNPHFLFNSLNSLFSLVKTDPDLSEKFILKLSSIYRYILENSDEELVPLPNELEFVKDYFMLQKIRDGEKINLKIEITEEKNIMILPVSLQLLVENALKHNSATRNNPLEIIIHNEGIDKLVVRNNIQKKSQLHPSSKIGLKNLRERSKLILNRTTEVVETLDEFIVKIPVKKERI